MRERKATCLYRELEQMSTEQLDALLQDEIQKAAPDENVVLPILKVLEERERDHPVEVSEEVMSAWERYQERIKPKHVRADRKRPRFGWVAAVAAVLCLAVIAFPIAADADSALDVLYHVTDSIVEFFRPGGGTDNDSEAYIFETDNPGLQQLYDKAVELGVTVPVVPMWLPEGYVLDELDVISNPFYQRLHARFYNGEDVIIIQITLSESITSTQYEQDEGMEIYDVSKVNHYVFDNGDHLSAAWVNENVEGMINITENKEILYNIIESIYWRK